MFDEYRRDRRTVWAAGENDPVVYEHMGDAAMKLGHYQDAIKAYQEALRRKHRHPEVIKRKLNQAQERLEGR